MILLGILLGGFAYLIFFLGLLGLFYKPVILLSLLLSFCVVYYMYRTKLKGFINVSRAFLKKKRDNVVIFILLLFIIQIGINLIGALGPETGFDAMWYHLTLPKLYLAHHAVYHVSGGLLKYSDMPKLIDMLFVPALALGNEIGAKLIEYVFGLLISLILYQLAVKILRPKFALIAVLIFYTNLVVGWESTSAYIDLGRTFFEILALYTFYLWYEARQIKNLILSAIFVGFATASKLLGLGSLFIFLVLLFFNVLPKTYDVRRKFDFKKISSIISHTAYVNIFLYVCIALLVPLPWFIFSYIHTRNPVYPFFSNAYAVHIYASVLLSPPFFIQSMLSIFLYSQDPISPLYLIFLPVILTFYPKFSKGVKLIGYYSLLGLIMWYITPQTGGGRFIIPYLPSFSLLCAAAFEQLVKKKMKVMYITGILAIFIVAFISIGYRMAANAKYVPVILGKESQNEFLAKHLNFHFGDFADIDGYFADHIKNTDTVLLYGFHNLYYVDFPFIDSSWVKKGDTFNYIAIQNGTLPNRFKHWQLVYKNDKTLVQLYKPPKGECNTKCRY